MKRYLSVLLLLLCCTMSALSQTKADTLISEHRQWMKKYYPKAESLSEEQLLREAAFAVYDHLQEPEAIALLHAVGRQVPTVESYASLTEQHMADTKYRYSIQALEALYGYAVSHLGENNPTTGWCKFLWLYLSGDMQNVEPQFTDAAIVQQRIADKTGNKENEALACLFKITRFCISNWSNIICNPDLYGYVLKTEKETVRLLKSQDLPKRTRAWLYAQMALAKSNMNGANVDIVYQCEQVKYDDTYELHDGIMSNAGYYFRMAEQEYLCIYPQGHPEFMNLYCTWENPQTPHFFFGKDEEEMQRVFCRYVQKYYPRGDIKQILQPLEREEARVRMGQKVDISYLYNTYLNCLKNNLGTTNAYLIGFVDRLASLLAPNSPEKYKLAENEFNRLVDHQCGSDSLKAACYRIGLYRKLRNLKQKEAMQAIEHAANIYERHHDSSVISILLGRMLTTYYFYDIKLYEQSYKFKSLVCEDLKAHYGETSPFYLHEKEDALLLLGQFDNKSASEQFSQVIKQMEAAKMDVVNAIDHFASIEQQGERYAHAAELSQEAYRLAAKQGLTHQCAHLLFRKFYALKHIENTTKEQEMIFKRIKKILDTNTDTLSFLPDNFYQAACYYRDKAEYAQALDMIDKGIAICKRQKQGFSSGYIALATLRYSIYFSNLNDKGMAYKLINEDMEEFEKQNLNAYTTEMLDYLCGVFNYYDNKYDDVYTWCRYFNLIGTMSLSIAEQNNFDEEYTLKYHSYILNKAVYWCEYYAKLKKRIDFSKLTETRKREIEEFFEPFDSIIALLSTIDQYIQAFEKAVPNYQQNVYYLQLLNTAEEYYLHIEPIFKKSEEYLKKHLQLSINHFPIEELKTLVKLGDLYRENGKYYEAKTHYTQAIKKIEKDNTQSIENKMSINSRMIAISQHLNNFDDMWRYTEKFYTYCQSIYDNNLRFLTQKEQEYTISTVGYPADWPTSCLAVYPKREKIAGKVYNAVLYSTGVQLRSQQLLQRTIAQSKDKELISMANKLRKLQSELKIENPSDLPDQQINDKGFDFQKAKAVNSYLNEVANKRNKMNALERQIIERATPYLKAKSQETSWTQVRDKLQPAEVAIEFIIADHSVMALVIKPKCKTPISVMLTSTDSLKAAISGLQTKSSAATARKLYNGKAVNLYGMLWQPLEKELKGVSKVYYATQGMLYSIAFAAISTPDGKYLADHYDLCPLTTTAQLVQDDEEESPKSILAMGNIYYTDKQRQQVATGDINGARGGEEDVSINDFSDRGAKRYHFKYLPFTKKEIEDLSSIIKDRQLTLEEGTEATEQNLRKQLAKKPDVLHLATHGFFIAKADDAREVPFFKHYSQAIENSMQRAGIALAGAEDTWTGVQQPEEANDGILTANEVAQMDLNGTQLVTLSACETALGDYSFEGVFGLPRGFKQAGVKSLLVSLWSVNDKSTSLLMSSFYRYWMQGETKQQAFKHAVNDVRKDYPEPFYWAPFVLLDATE